MQKEVVRRPATEKHTRPEYFEAAALALSEQPTEHHPGHGEHHAAANHAANHPTDPNERISCWLVSEDIHEPLSLSQLS
jgi:hypothetical protein